MGWGWRGRGWTGPWPGRGPFSYLPPWQRPGWLFGFGRGFGRGWWWGANPYVCARFPWLPRWWWANPAYAYGFAYPYMTYPWYSYGYPWYSALPYTRHWYPYSYTAYPWYW